MPRLNNEQFSLYQQRSSEGTDKCINHGCFGGWNSLKYSKPEFDEGLYCGIVVVVTCEMCGEIWNETYSLTGVEVDGDKTD